MITDAKRGQADTIGDSSDPAQKRLKQKIISPEIIPAGWGSEDDLNTMEKNVSKKDIKVILFFSLLVSADFDVYTSSSIRLKSTHRARGSPVALASSLPLQVHLNTPTLAKGVQRTTDRALVGPVGLATNVT